MKLIEKIKLIRSFPSSLDLKYELFFTTSILVLGLGLGFISKMLDSNLILGDIFTGFGPWIFIATLIAAYSRYPISAMINTMIFFLGMLLTYYAYSYFILGFFPQSYMMIWLIMTFTFVPIAAFIAWFSKAKGLIGVICSELPITMLFILGCLFFSSYNVGNDPIKQEVFFRKKILYLTNLILGIMLNILLPRTRNMKIIVFAISILISGIIWIIIEF